MNTLLNKVVAQLNGAKVHATHTAIKGKKSGGSRDTNGNDWRKDNNGSGLA
ncbi:hypothetical protein [Aequorivita sinensis]|uniref:hypothetical protein n=1 Tax=Aequorivita sinensis TaxID=1382458 RepID=UPI0022FFEBD2|nr:hypothetical protein [Aequorivita sinensis]